MNWRYLKIKKPALRQVFSKNSINAIFYFPSFHFASLTDRFRV
jgi:hypothetical protein